MKLNVLSIDWDYFIDATETERLILFPDGGNERLGADLRSYVWTMRYSDSRIQKERKIIDRCIEDIGVREDALKFVKCCLYNITDDTQMGFADSHSSIYALLKENEPISNRQFNIYNIDHHSDCYNIGNDLNCGNWVNKLDAENYISKYIWIKNEDSGDENIKDVLNCKSRITTDLSIIKDIQWDYVFICRSGVWSPPHLDIKFNDFYSFTLVELGLTFNKEFFTDRYEPMKAEIEAYRDISVKQMDVIEHNIRHGCTDELQTLQEIFNDNIDNTL